MNPNDSELEQQLRLMRPRSASVVLEEKIAAALDRQIIPRAERVPTMAMLHRPERETSGFFRWLQGLGWAVAGAAVAIAFIALTERPNPAKAPAVAGVTAAPAEAFEHTGSTEELVTAEDEGLVLDRDQEPVRQVRYHSLERHVWVNPQTGARMEFEVPREDVRFVSVAMQ